MADRTAEILAIDAGTSSLKAVLYTGAGRVAGMALQRYAYRSPQPGWAEADPEVWWLALKAALSSLAGQGFALGSVEALSVTGQMHTAVLLDGDGHVIAPTILWLDRRADRETEELRQKLSLPPYQLNSTYTLPKLLWLYRHQPEALARTRTLLWPKDYIRYRLTGEVCTDRTEPGGAALLDWESRDWAIERLRLVGLDPGVLPPIRPADGQGGQIGAAVARELGLDPGVRVVVGMGDVAALFGAAPPQPGRVTCSLGSSSMVFAPLADDQVVHDPAHRLYVYPFGPYPMLGGVSSTTGSSLTWAIDKLGQAEGTPFEEQVARALEVEPGADGLCFLPYLAGERSPYWSDEIRGGFYGLRLTHDSRHLVRAVMEGVAYSLRHLLDLYDELAVPIGEIALAGGGAGTPGWAQIVADACQRPVLVYAEQETVTRVLYALCRAHLGREPFEPALLRTFDEPAIITPCQMLEATYLQGYRRYHDFARFAWQQAMAAPPPFGCLTGTAESFANGGTLR
jgi:xylulokinase